MLKDARADSYVVLTLQLSDRRIIPAENATNIVKAYVVVVLRGLHLESLK